MPPQSDPTHLSHNRGVCLRSLNFFLRRSSLRINGHHRVRQVYPMLLNCFSILTFISASDSASPRFFCKFHPRARLWGWLIRNCPLYPFRFVHCPTTSMSLVKTNKPNGMVDSRRRLGGEVSATIFLGGGLSLTSSTHPTNFFFVVVELLSIIGGCMFTLFWN